MAHILAKDGWSSQDSQSSTIFFFLAGLFRRRFLFLDSHHARDSCCGQLWQDWQQRDRLCENTLTQIERPAVAGIVLLWRVSPKRSKDKTMTVKIDVDKCEGCAACESECPTEALKLNEETNKIAVDPDKCADCGACVDVCPTNALSLD